MREKESAEWRMRERELMAGLEVERREAAEMAVAQAVAAEAVTRSLSLNLQAQLAEVKIKVAQTECGEGATLEERVVAHSEAADAAIADSLAAHAVARGLSADLSRQLVLCKEEAERAEAAWAQASTQEERIASLLMQQEVMRQVASAEWRQMESELLDKKTQAVRDTAVRAQSLALGEQLEAVKARAEAAEITRRLAAASSREKEAELVATLETQTALLRQASRQKDSLEQEMRSRERAGRLAALEQAEKAEVLVEESSPASSPAPSPASSPVPSAAPQPKGGTGETPQAAAEKAQTAAEASLLAERECRNFLRAAVTDSDILNPQVDRCASSVTLAHVPMSSIERSIMLIQGVDPDDDSIHDSSDYPDAPSSRLPNAPASSAAKRDAPTDRQPSTRRRSFMGRATTVLPSARGVLNRFGNATYMTL
mmetsp:Transcript_68993/g.206922  ORF Transcript_68993/g.206922 Transcript_68993/m.206922 type:complete len:428 (-) Transcript_68993:245-1528(-)